MKYKNDLTIRPSSLAEYVQCSYKWYNTHLLDVRGPTNNRANIGTGVHAGAEAFWKEAMKAGKKPDINDSEQFVKDSLVEYEKVTDESDGVVFDEGQNVKTSKLEVERGIKSWIKGLSRDLPIPIAVEERFTINVTNPIAKRVSGSLDYLAKDELTGGLIIGDIKTAKQARSTNNYSLQQSIYRLLVDENREEKVVENHIQLVKLAKTGVTSEIKDMPVNVPQAQAVTGNILKALNALDSTDIPPEVLFPPNPMHFLCSKKFCSAFNECRFAGKEK